MRVLTAGLFRMSPVEVVGVYDEDPAGAAGLRFSGFQGWWVDGGGQAGRGMAAMRAKTATMSSTQGQVAGIRRCRSRALWVSRAGTCSNR
jgi:hypothetical protein